MSTAVNAVAAGASAINPLLGAGIGLIGNLASSGMQNRANRKLWEAQNAYNHPTKQMQRLQEAGLNPNLIYGSGAQSATGNASPPPKAEPHQLGNIGTDIMGYQRHNLETNNLSKLNDDIQSRADLNVQKTLTEIERTNLTGEQHNQLKQARDANLSTVQHRAQMDMYKASKAHIDYLIDNNLNDQQIGQLSKASFQAKMDEFLLKTQNLSNAGKLNELRELQRQLLQSNVDTFTTNAVVRWLTAIFGVATKF